MRIKDRRQSTEDRAQSTEDRRQKAEDRRQKIEKNIKLQNITKNILDNLDLNNVILLDEIKKAWKGMGTTLYNHAHPVSFRNGKLIMVINESLWYKQLIKFRKDITTQLNRYFNKPLIKDIEFIENNTFKR